MTAIVGLVHEGKVWMGGDSAGVGGLSLSLREDPKVFINGELLIGYTTSFRMGQILEHHLSPPAALEKETGMAYMVKRFIPAVKSELKDHGFQRSKEGQDEGGSFLVGYRGALYAIDDDYQVARLRTPYFAVGCGRDLALGALFAMKMTSMGPDARIKLALEAAAEFSAGVRGPFTILHL